VSGSDPPRDGGKRAATLASAAPATAANRPKAAGSGAPAATPAPSAAVSARPAKAPRAPLSEAAAGAAAGLNASIAPRLRASAAGLDKVRPGVDPKEVPARSATVARKETPPRPAVAARKEASTRSSAGTRNEAIPRPDSPAAPAAPSPAEAQRPQLRGAVPYSRETERAVPGAGEPYPPLSQRPVTANGAASTASKTSKRLTPRSPRTALEPDQVEIPTRRSKSARNPFVVVGNAVISLFVLVAVVAAVALVIGKQRFDAVGPLPENRIVNIPRGTGIRDIAEVLVREGVINQPWVFVGSVLVLKAREDLKAGEYQFKAHASVRDVVATIVEGRVVPHQFTIPEGLTSEQIVARLLADDVLLGNIREVPREGSLLPDTYSFTRGATREQMIQRMQQAQQRVVKEIWEHRSPDLPIKTPDQLVILASLVEKETGRPDERTRVAAVFVNRLKQKMRLQSDPTIIYGLVGGKGTLGRSIMKSEIDQPTPYNTYQIDGLPPGPIANPGRASLEAAANPARTRELYFVADGNGGHVFAETYEQHQKNVARLRSAEADQKQPAASEEQPGAHPPAPSPPRRGRHNSGTKQTTR